MNLEFSAEVREELNPEFSVIHVVETHLFLGVVADKVPLLVPVPPVAPPLVPVPPGVPHPDQTDPVPPLGPRRVDPVEPRDGVGVALHQAVLVRLPRVPPVAFSGASDEGLQ